MQATTIKEVLNTLHQIIETAEAEESAMGYFAALYIKVTKTIQKGIAQNMFDDGDRMNRMVIAFANGYLKTYAEYRASGTESSVDCWTVSFKEAGHYWPTVLQHLMGAMNAHINYDLGIAAAMTAPGKEIHNFEKDFNLINKVLGSLVDEVTTEIGLMWPFFKKMLKVMGNFDNFLIDFSMKIARDGAWKFAVKLAQMNPEEQVAFMKERDRKIVKTAELVYSPGWIASAINRMIRLSEKGSVAGRVQLMAGHDDELSEADLLAYFG